MSIYIKHLPWPDPIPNGEIRVSLESKGKTIGPLDMLIAAHALSLDLTIISNNSKEFKRIPNLKCENWIGEL
jgi:tRNA(fMet)-specific endonuclease VapC